MAQNPTVYTTIVNRLNQSLDLVEHPTLGDEAVVIIVSHELKLAFHSDFFETGDMELGEDYEPLIIDGQLFYNYQIS